MTIYVKELLLTDVSATWADNILWVESTLFVRLVRWERFVSLLKMVLIGWNTHVKFAISHVSIIGLDLSYSRLIASSCN